MVGFTIGLLVVAAAAVGLLAAATLVKILIANARGTQPEVESAASSEDASTVDTNN